MALYGTPFVIVPPGSGVPFKTYDEDFAQQFAKSHQMRVVQRIAAHIPALESYRIPTIVREVETDNPEVIKLLEMGGMQKLKEAAKPETPSVPATQAPRPILPDFNTMSRDDLVAYAAENKISIDHRASRERILVKVREATKDW